MKAYGYKFVSLNAAKIDIAEIFPNKEFTSFCTTMFPSTTMFQSGPCTVREEEERSTLEHVGKINWKQ